MAILIIAVIAIIVLVLACCKVSGEYDEQMYNNINWDYVKYFNERHEEEY